MLKYMAIRIALATMAATFLCWIVVNLFYFVWYLEFPVDIFLWEPWARMSLFVAGIIVVPCDLFFDFIIGDKR